MSTRKYVSRYEKLKKIKKNKRKLKLIKSYLRSTMSQERLRGLAILSIEKKMLEELEYKNLISQFVSQKAKKIYFK